MMRASSRAVFADAVWDGRSIRIDGPLLVFGGPYGNLEATLAVFAEADRRGIGRGNIVCTGDLVAYCADPQAVVDLIRHSGIHVIAGNCEEALVAGSDDCGCGFPEASACAVLSDQWYPYADRKVEPQSREWMATLSGRIDLEVGEFRLAVVHGGFAQSNRFIFASDDTAMEQELSLTSADGIIAGHCGLPFTRVMNGRVWHNSGVIGMPANDGTPRVWFSIVEPVAGGLDFEHCALEYDCVSAAARMRRNDLPEGYAACLETGIWPSFDVLPADERARRGAPLTASATTWRPAPSVSLRS